LHICCRPVQLLSALLRDHERLAFLHVMKLHHIFTVRIQSYQGRKQRTNRHSHDAAGAIRLKQAKHHLQPQKNYQNHPNYETTAKHGNPPHRQFKAILTNHNTFVHNTMESRFVKDVFFEKTAPHCLPE